MTTEKSGVGADLPKHPPADVMNAITEISAKANKEPPSLSEIAKAWKIVQQDPNNKMRVTFAHATLDAVQIVRARALASETLSPNPVTDEEFARALALIPDNYTQEQRARAIVAHVAGWRALERKKDEATDTRAYVKSTVNAMQGDGVILNPKADTIHQIPQAAPYLPEGVERFTCAKIYGHLDNYPAALPAVMRRNMIGTELVTLALWRLRGVVMTGRERSNGLGTVHKFFVRDHSKNLRLRGATFSVLVEVITNLHDDRPPEHTLTIQLADFNAVAPHAIIISDHTMDLIRGHNFRLDISAKEPVPTTSNPNHVACVQTIRQLADDIAAHIHTSLRVLLMSDVERAAKLYDFEHRLTLNKHTASRAQADVELDL